ncbi:hypothetical protein DXG01_011001 [Tephrocybe rancida]|nr:hypothetical protein DXG01_011001 [Tephrocybe rancida]
MSTKHIYPSSDGLVLKALRGAVALNPSLKIHSTSKTVYTYGESHAQDIGQFTSPPCVAIISGGGAGHEPAHAGYTGRGMLSASVSGDIFASPSAKQILQAIYLASSSGAIAYDAHHATETYGWKDVVVIINNYTGDRLNFGLAIEKALASSLMKVESVVVADDVSLLQPISEPRSRKSLVGARGLAGNILVCKILGALVQRGADIAHVKILGDAVVQNLASVGVGLDHCHVPGREAHLSGTMVMSEEECEIGLGLHNEPGVTRKKMEGPDKLVADMLRLILRSKDGIGEFLHVASGEGGRPTDDVILFLNNLGGVSQLELAAVLDEVLEQLASMGVHPLRVFSSSYMTSLNAPGFSISILNISNIENSLNASSTWNNTATVIDLLDDPTDAVAWVGARRWPASGHARDAEERGRFNENENPRAPEPSRIIARTEVVSNWTVRSMRSACEYVLLQQEALTEFDTILGDGDCGNTFGAGARAILSLLDNGAVNLNEMPAFELVEFLGNILEDQMGGTIGALFAIFLTAVSTSLRASEEPTTPQHWGTALIAGLMALRKYTPAKPGDRTLVDALEPFCATLLQDGSNIQKAVDAARKGAEDTRSMEAVLGRAAYVTPPKGVEILPPDPGAWGVLAIVEGLCKGLSEVD